MKNLCVLQLHVVIYKLQNYNHTKQYIIKALQWFRWKCVAIQNCKYNILHNTLLIHSQLLLLCVQKVLKEISFFVHKKAQPNKQRNIKQSTLYTDLKCEPVKR